MAVAEKMTYASAGVDIDAGDSFAEMIKARVAAAWPGGGDEIGGFAGGGPIPGGAVIVKGSTDGTGTKAILAAMTGILGGIGQDAVAMTAVDAYIAGAKPWYLLDSLGVDHLEPELHIQIVESIIQGCILADCKLIGGETAELPGLYKHPWMFDLNAMAIGFPDPGLEFVPVKPGQLVYGFLSHGLGSNGYSLAREVFKLKEKPSVAKQRLQREWPTLGGTLAEILLRPTAIHIDLLEQLRTAGVRFAGHAHITGGGLPGNIPRILPVDCVVAIDRSKWPRPSIFPLIQKEGNVPEDDMTRTFNQGLQVVTIVDEEYELTIEETLGPAMGEVWKIGRIEKRDGEEPQVRITGQFKDEVGY